MSRSQYQQIHSTILRSLLPSQRLRDLPEMDYSYYTTAAEYEDPLIVTSSNSDYFERGEDLDEHSTISNSGDDVESYPHHQYNDSLNEDDITEEENEIAVDEPQEEIYHMPAPFPSSPDEHENSVDSANKLYGQNLIMFGHIERRRFIKAVQNCSSYTKIDLFSKYSMNEIMASSQGNFMGQLVLYFNMLEVNMANYDIALERIKRILDHFTMTYQGLAFYSIVRGNERGRREDALRRENELHWKLNNAAMSYCSMDYPRCHIVPDLSSIIKGLNQSYIKDQTLEEYSMKNYVSKNCRSDRCPSREIELESRPTLSELPLAQQLDKFTQVFCRVTYHRIVEFTSKLPGQEEFLPDPTTPPTFRYFLIILILKYCFDFLKYT